MNFKSKTNNYYEDNRVYHEIIFKNVKINE